MANDFEICVFGAGNIGCYVGGRLAGARAKVSFVGRPRIIDEIATNGLHLTDLHGAKVDVLPAQVRFDSAPNRADRADMVLICVKSAAVEEVAKTLAPLLKPGTVVVALQNGIEIAQPLVERLPDCIVLRGIVMFNVVARGEGRFHQASEGELMVEENPALDRFATVFRNAGLPILTRADMTPVLWGKLMLNLNNPINALSGIPLKEELSQRDYRRCLSLAQAEALELLKLDGIAPTPMTSVPYGAMIRLLKLPNMAFTRLAGKVLQIDPLARSSMWDDLELGRKTEIDWLCGEVVRLGEKLGRHAPVNSRLMDLIHVAERGGRRQWSGAELLRTLEAAGRADSD
ncbi:2-dehydropantoate 2-reductase [Antrihabitans stalactiti]|uniref:2-dehydropantoate 2-reductase n=1 Tax=Antrihabitans stalactiti TaxID=2584121 RepID=A0A848KLE3_9NOCA|nr:2-dehydropantoate 2-reductase [Antrihabitans stalactiti]NMN98718.1 2-dehydropantoate 2-reductase [Antrihabitans stalactiti]